MSITGAITGGIAAVKTGASLYDKITGGGEKGSGMTKRETLAHAIDKYDNANDYEAIRIAKKIVNQRAFSERQAVRIIARDLGYSTSEILANPNGKWTYVKRMLAKTKREVEEAERQQQMQTQSVSSDPDPDPNSEFQQAQQAGMGQLPILLLVGAGAYFIINN